ncbi:MAG: LytTR family transcriptional regulator [Lachnospiraceae bacterium]|nr:LytTR family transcriptional regulator [Lachnospiraceae bacterium]
MIKIVICFENEMLMKYLEDEIKSFFGSRGVITEIMSYSNVSRLLHFPVHTDIVLFNAEMQHGTVIQAVERLKQLNRNLVSIAANSMPELNYEQLFRLQPLFLLNETCSKNALRNVICRAYEMAMTNAAYFSYYKRPEYKRISISDIIYFYSEARVIHIVTADGEDCFYHKLDEIEKILITRDYHFMRIHKSFLVNPAYIEHYDRKTMRLITGEVLLISEYNRKQTNQYLKGFLELSADKI